MILRRFWRRRRIGLDPLEGYNRFMTDVNDWLFLNVLDPVASGYAYVVPQGGRHI